MYGPFSLRLNLGKVGINMDVQDIQDGGLGLLVNRLYSSFGLLKLMRSPTVIPVALR